MLQLRIFPKEAFIRGLHNCVTVIAPLVKPTGRWRLDGLFNVTKAIIFETIEQISESPDGIALPNCSNHAVASFAVVKKVTPVIENVPLELRKSAIDDFGFNFVHRDDDSELQRSVTEAMETS